MSVTQGTCTHSHPLSPSTLTNQASPGHTGEQIRDHKLACSVINFHNTPDAVFDDDCLEELKSFTVARTIANRDKWLADRGLIDGPDGSRVGTRAANEGSLTGLLVARYGTDNAALDEKDWGLLAEWFAKGMPEGEHVAR